MRFRTQKRPVHYSCITISRAWETVNKWDERRGWVGYDHYPKVVTVKVGSVFTIHTNLNYRPVETEWRIGDLTVVGLNHQGTFVALKPGLSSVYSTYYEPGTREACLPPRTALADVIVTP